MSDLEQRADSLLARYREQMFDDEAVVRLRRKLGPQFDTPVARGPWLASARGMVGGGLLLVGATAVAAWLLTGVSNETAVDPASRVAARAPVNLAVTPVVTVPAVTAPATQSVSRQGASIAQTLSPAPAERAEQEAPVTGRVGRSRGDKTSAVAKVKVAPKPIKPAASPDFSEETRLIKRATKLLRWGNPQAALRTLAEHERRFGERGVFGAERVLLRVMAKCATGDFAQARRGAELFRLQYPRHALTGRLAHTCVGKASR